MLLGLRRFQTVLTNGELVVTEKIAFLVVIISVLVLETINNLPYQRIPTYVINMTLQKLTVVSHHSIGRVFQIV